MEASYLKLREKLNKTRHRQWRKFKTIEEAMSRASFINNDRSHLTSKLWVTITPIELDTLRHPFDFLRK